MKKIFLTMIVLSFTLLLKAQENNPFNQVGLDYVSSIKIITEDFKAGKVKDFSMEALEEYSQKIPLKTEVNMELVTSIFQTIKTKDFNFKKFIDQSSLSDVSKNTFKLVSLNPEKLDKDEFMGLLKNEVETIKESKISNSEKEMVLSFISIVSNSFDITPDYNNSNCSMSGPEGSGPQSCIIIGAGIGGIIGWSICGPLCGLGGAIIGGVVGSFS